MPFDRQQSYLTWGGRLSVAAEDYWQCGIRFAFGTNTLVPPAFTTGMLEAAADALVAFHTSANSHICTGAKLDWVKVAYLEEDGTYAEEPQIIDGLDASGGGLGTSAAGADVSVAITLWSGQTFGRANYGRFYTPWNTVSVQASNGKMDPTGQGQIAQNAETLLEALYDVGEAAPGTEDLLPSIMSTLDSGTTKRVAEVRVGNLKDTQRRRENRMAETYVSLAVS